MRPLLTRGRKCNYITVVTWRDDLRWTWDDEKNCTNTRDQVAYLLAADNISEPLSTRLSGVNQPVIRTQNAFSTLLPRLLADS